MHFYGIHLRAHKTSMAQIPKYIHPENYCGPPHPQRTDRSRVVSHEGEAAVAGRTQAVRLARCTIIRNRGRGSVSRSRKSTRADSSRDRTRRSFRRDGAFGSVLLTKLCLFALSRYQALASEMAITGASVGIFIGRRRFSLIRCICVYRF